MVVTPKMFSPWVYYITGLPAEVTRRRKRCCRQFGRWYVSCGYVTVEKRYHHNSRFVEFTEHRCVKLMPNPRRCHRFGGQRDDEVSRSPNTVVDPIPKPGTVAECCADVQNPAIRQRDTDARAVNSHKVPAPNQNLYTRDCSLSSGASELLAGRVRLHEDTPGK